MFGVVVLHKDLGYGTDIRFTGHPQCVVWSDKIPTPYDYLQFCGRSQRANVRTDCVLYTVEDPAAERYIKRELTEVDDAPFKDGGEILSQVKQHLHDRQIAKQSFLQTPLPKATDMNWKLSLGEWIEEISKHGEY